MKLHERIREARRLLGMSQEAVAAQVGVSRGAVAQWEMPSGTAPSVENLIKMASLSGVSFEWLATGRGAKVHEEGGVVREPRATYQAPLPDPLEESIRIAVTRLTQSKKRALLELLAK